jgi:hypothetical protein
VSYLTFIVDLQATNATPTQLEALNTKLKDVESISKKFDSKIQYLIERHLTLIEDRRQTVLIKCLQIIHRERRLYEKVSLSHGPKPSLPQQTQLAQLGPTVMVCLLH